MSTPVSEHFTLEELTATETGLPNVPGADELSALDRLTAICLELMRAMAGPLKVDSGFRSQAVNSAVGGVPTSQHTRGEAADVVPANMTCVELFDRTRASSIQFDQLILEFGWVHVSTAPLGRAPRRQCLRARHNAGKTVYDPVFS